MTVNISGVRRYSLCKMSTRV